MTTREAAGVGGVIAPTVRAAREPANASSANGFWAPPTAPAGLAPGFGPAAPPTWGPSALGVGAGGASPAVTLPPTPGPIKEPPLPVAPPPKESDLRVIPGMLADGLGVASPVAAAQEAGGSAPYFLELAGPPEPGPGLGPGLSANDVRVPTTLFGADSAAVPGTLLGTPADPFQGAPVGVPGVGAADGVGALLPLSLADAQRASEPYFLAGADAQSSAADPYFLALAGLPGSQGSGDEVEGGDQGVSSPASHATGATQPDAAASKYDAAASHFDPTIGPAARAAKGPFDASTIKRDFPILRERVHGRPLVWLDNAATTQKPQVVIDRISYYYEHENSNVHRAAHTLAARATDAYEGARDTVRRFLNAPSAQDIVFVRGTTEAINLVAKSWGERHVRAGDEIVVTWLEHHANIVPWQQLCEGKGACLRVAPVDGHGQVILEQYERLLGPRTRLVSFSHVSNALGTIVPARHLIEMAHRHGALVLVDGAQAVSHMPVDVQALDCDFYCFSGHKVFAPTGIGALYGKRDVLSSMPPWQGGGNMIADVTFEKTTYQSPPQRFEAGTSSIADAVGLGAALDYVSALGMENIARYEHELLAYATEGLARVPGLRLVGTAAEKAAVLSFVLDGARTEDIGAALDQEGIAVRSGHHCAQPILRRFGLESTVRASLAPYNTREDVDALVAALQRIQTGRPLR